MSQTPGLSFALPVGYDTGTYGTQSVAIADVNGDGRLDVIVANSNANYCACNDVTVSVLLGNGDGTYQTAATYDGGGLEPAANLFSVAAADLNGDGKPDIVVSLNRVGSSGSAVGVLLNKGDGTFQTVVTYKSGGLASDFVAIADVNGDGKPDILVANWCSSVTGCNSGSVSVLLGNGDGTFQTAASYDTGGALTTSVAVADLNGDGKTDLVAGNNGQNNLSVLLGNGDGSFQTAVTYATGGYSPSSVAVADVNGDGKPDILVANSSSSLDDGDGTVGVLLGNGNGTFHAADAYDAGEPRANFVGVGDMNGDGKPDIVVTTVVSVGVLLNNGNGIFQTTVNEYGSGGSEAQSAAIADINGDGKPDIVAANYCDDIYCVNRQGGSGSVGVLLNTSTNATTTALVSSPNPTNFGQVVTFTATLSTEPGFYTGRPTGTVALYDQSTATSLGNSALNASGIATFQISTLGPSTHSIIATYSGDTKFASSVSPAVSQVVLGAAAKYSPTSIAFGNETVGMSSAPQRITLTNTGDTPLIFTSISITGTNPANFTQTNTCGSSLAGGASCIFSVTFKPTATGERSAALTLSDNAPSKVQKVPLTGVGVLPAVTFTPSALTVPRQLVYTSSTPQMVTLTNTGLGILHISKIAGTAPFSQTNNCGSTVNPAGSCTISVTFQPTARGVFTESVSVTDNAPASSQNASLTGTGTVVQLTPSGFSFGTQPVHTTSLAKTITLTNKGHAAVSITSVSITGADAGDFSQTNTCGNSIASGASCFIRVKFTPTATGSRSAAVSISDNGGGSPQRVGLAGTGT